MEQKHSSESYILKCSKTVYALVYMKLYCMGYLLFSLSFENGQISNKIDKEEMQRILTMISHGQ